VTASTAAGNGNHERPAMDGRSLDHPTAPGVAFRIIVVGFAVLDASIRGDAWTVAGVIVPTPRPQGSTRDLAVNGRNHRERDHEASVRLVGGVCEGATMHSGVVSTTPDDS